MVRLGPADSPLGRCAWPPRTAKLFAWRRLGAPIGSRGRWQAASLTEEFARGERRLDRAEFDPAEAERERWLGRKLPDRSPERRN